jgi:hypothetical protein
MARAVTSGEGERMLAKVLTGAVVGLDRRRLLPVD